MVSYQLFHHGIQFGIRAGKYFSLFRLEHHTLDILHLGRRSAQTEIFRITLNDIQSNPEDLGLSGSPTKVKNIESVVFQAKEAKVLSGTDAELDAMMKELITNHTIG